MANRQPWQKFLQLLSINQYHQIVRTESAAQLMILHDYGLFLLLLFCKHSIVLPTKPSSVLRAYCVLTEITCGHVTLLGVGGINIWRNVEIFPNFRISTLVSLGKYSRLPRGPLVGVWGTVCCGNLHTLPRVYLYTDSFMNVTKRSIIPLPKTVSPLLSFSLSLNFYLSKHMFISLRGPRGAWEGLVKEHGMLMVWKRYE